MKIISKARGCGKTHDAVNLCRETGAYLIVHNKSEGRRILTQYPDMQGKVIDYSAIENRSINGVRSVVIDNIELFLQNFLAADICAITTNWKTEEPWRPIETAPKDGSKFWAYCSINKRIFLTSWYKHTAVAGWIAEGIDCNDNEFAPTHWITQPPQEASDERD